MKHKVQRDVLSQKAGLFRVNVCAPPSNNKLSKSTCRNERMSLCALKKGSLTVEAALILPWVIGILLTFFSYFQQYELGAQLSIRAAAEAKKIAIAVGCSQEEDYGDVVIYQSQVWEPTSFFAILGEKAITQKAVCRPWIGFTDQEDSETYVYVTPNGSVYHLFRDCTHLNISTKAVEAQKAKSMKNQYGKKYYPCELCDPGKEVMLYVTEEGSRYHSKKDCSGLKRTVLRVEIRQVKGKDCCMRCMEREA